MSKLNTILTNFVVTEEGVAKIQRLLADLVKDVDADAALLVEKSGQMLATDGNVQGIDVTAVASLVAATFSSTRAVARLIGESEFQAMFQQGEATSIFMYVLGTNDILVVIFKDVSKTGLVKVQAEQTALALSAQLHQMKSS